MGGVIASVFTDLCVCVNLVVDKVTEFCLLVRGVRVCRWMGGGHDGEMEPISVSELTF